jgi:transposase-like protein
MKIVGMRIKTRAVRLEKGRKSVPYRAKVWINGQDVDLGRYKTHEEAAAACRAVRKLFPAKGTTRPPLSDERRAAILATYEQLKSGRATARVHGVSHETVQRIVKGTPEAAALGRDPREPVGDCW